MPREMSQLARKKRLYEGLSLQEITDALKKKTSEPFTRGLAYSTKEKSSSVSPAFHNTHNLTTPKDVHSEILHSSRPPQEISENYSKSDRHSFHPSSLSGREDVNHKLSTGQKNPPLSLSLDSVSRRLNLQSDRSDDSRKSEKNYSSRHSPDRSRYLSEHVDRASQRHHEDYTSRKLDFPKDYESRLVHKRPRSPSPEETSRKKHSSERSGDFLSHSEKILLQSKEKTVHAENSASISAPKVFDLDNYVVLKDQMKSFTQQLDMLKTEKNSLSNIQEDINKVRYKIRHRILDEYETECSSLYSKVKKNINKISEQITETYKKIMDFPASVKIEGEKIKLLEEKGMLNNSMTGPGYVFEDQGNHWCSKCNIILPSDEDMFRHMFLTKHLQKLQKNDRPWENLKVAENAPSIGDKVLKTNLKGAQFLVSIPSNYYCELCKKFSFDLVSARKHVRSDEHNSNYEAMVSKNPYYERSYKMEKHISLTSFCGVVEELNEPPTPMNRLEREYQQYEEMIMNNEKEEILTGQGEPENPDLTSEQFKDKSSKVVCRPSFLQTARSYRTDKSDESENPSPLTLLRQYHMSKEHIVQSDDSVIFGKHSFPKTVKTNYIIWGFDKDGKTPEYYTLECLLFFLQNKHLPHPEYVKQAQAKKIPFVRRPDRRDLEAYLKGITSTSTRIDKNPSFEEPLQAVQEEKKEADINEDNKFIVAGIEIKLFSRCVSFRWKTPDKKITEGSPIVKYSVLKKVNLQGFNWMHLGHVKPQQCSFTATGLRPGTEYQFRIIANFADKPPLRIGGTMLIITRESPIYGDPSGNQKAVVKLIEDTSEEDIESSESSAPYKARRVPSYLPPLSKSYHSLASLGMAGLSSLDKISSSSSVSTERDKKQELPIKEPKQEQVEKVNLKTVCTGTDFVEFSWPPLRIPYIKDAFKLLLYKKSLSDGQVELINFLPVTFGSYKARNLKPDSEYEFELKAVYLTGIHLVVNNWYKVRTKPLEEKVLPKEKKVEKPKQESHVELPANTKNEAFEKVKIEVEDKGSNYVEFSWPTLKVPRATEAFGLMIYRRRLRSEKWELVTPLPVKLLKYKSKKLMPGTTYEFEIRVGYITGEEIPVSKILTVTTQTVVSEIKGMSGRKKELMAEATKIANEVTVKEGHLKIVRIQSDSVSVCWKAPSWFTEKQITKYFIEKLCGVQVWNQVSAVDPVMTGFVISKLKPATKYIFRVRARLVNGLCVTAAKPVEVTTLKEGEVGECPIASELEETSDETEDGVLELMESNLESITLKWEMPDNLPVGEEAIKFYILKKEKGDKEWRKIASIPSSLSVYTVNKLSQNKKQYFRIKALITTGGVINVTTPLRIIGKTLSALSWVTPQSSKKT